MPRIELSASKGLVQVAGQGLIDKDAVLSYTADLDLTAAAATAAQKGAIVHSFILAAGKTITLHTSDAVTGQIKIIMNSTASGAFNLTVAGASIQGAGALTLAPGDIAICVFNGTKWEAGISNI